MERLTLNGRYYSKPNGDIWYSKFEDSINFAINRNEISDKLNKLVNYENTGLEPSEIVELKEENEQLKQKIKILASECEDCQKTCFDAKIEQENEQLKQQVKGLEFDRTMCMNGNIKLSMQLTDSYNDIKQLKQQLAEKDELLKNAVVPKFKVGDEVWLIEENGLTDKKELMNCKIQRHSIEYKVDGIFSRTWYYDDSLFATKEEAQKKLEELR